MILLHLGNIGNYLFATSAIFCVNPMSRLNPFPLERLITEAFSDTFKGGKVGFAYALPSLVADNIVRTGPITSVSNLSKCASSISTYARVVFYLSWQTSITSYLLYPVFISMFTWTFYRLVVFRMRRAGISFADLEQGFFTRAVIWSLAQTILPFNKLTLPIIVPLAYMFSINARAPSIFMLLERIRILSGETRASSSALPKAAIYLVPIMLAQTVTAMALFFALSFWVPNRRPPLVDAVALGLYVGSLALLVLLWTTVSAMYYLVGCVYVIRNGACITAARMATPRYKGDTVDIVAQFIKYVKR